MNTSGAEVSLGRLKGKVKEVGEESKKVGREGGGGLDEMAKKAEGAADRFTRQVKRVADAEAALLAGPKGSPENFLALAGQRGIDPNTPGIAAEIARLESLKLKRQEVAAAAQKSALLETEAANRARIAADAALIAGARASNGLGNTAKQTVAALRQVPAQFTDIVVSLQGGQNPLTVLLQQGGQLKDVFGGVGNAARALGGYILGLVNPFTVTVAAAAGLAYAFQRGAQEAGEFTKALILSGNQAGTTTGQLQLMSRGVSAATGVSVSAAAEALTAFAASGKVGAERLERFASVAVIQQKLTGKAVADTVREFAELGKDPLTASLRLNETTGFLTRSVEDQIRALMKRGEQLQAGVVAQNAYADAEERNAPRIQAAMSNLENNWNVVWSAAKRYFDLVITHRSDTTPEVKASNLNAKIKAEEESIALIKGQRGGPSALDTAQLRSREKNLAGLREEMALEQGKAQDAAKFAAIKKGVQDDDARHRKFIALADQNETKAAREKRLITEAKTLGKGEDPAALEAVLAGIRERNKPAAGNRTDVTANIRERMQAQREAASLELDTAAKLTAADRDRISTLKDITKALREKKISEAQAALLRGEADDTFNLQKQVEDRDRLMKSAQKHAEERQALRIKEDNEIKQFQDGVMEKERQFWRDIEAATPTAKLEEQRRVLMKITEGFAEGRFGDANSAEAIKKYNEVVQTYLNILPAAVKESITAAEQLGEAFSKTFESALMNATSFSDVLLGLEQDLKRVAIQQLIMDPIKRGFDKSISSSSDDSLLTTAARWFTGLSFDGGGSTGSGSRSGGVDGKGGFMAILHPQETVTDHAAGQSTPGGGGDVFNFNINATVGDIASKSDVIAGMRATAQQIQASFMRSRTHGGLA